MEFKISPLNIDEKEQLAEVVDSAFIAFAQKHFKEPPPPNAKLPSKVTLSRLHHPNVGGFTIKTPKGKIAGVCICIVRGKTMLIGPMVIHPDYQAKSGMALIGEHTHNEFEKSGCQYAEYATFSNSVLHFNIYSKQGMSSVRLVCLQKSVRPVNHGIALAKGIVIKRASSLNRTGLQKLQQQTYDFTNTYNADLDLTGDIDYVLDRQLGEVLFSVFNGTVTGVAICHAGENSESFFSDSLLVKSLYTTPANELSTQSFVSLIHEAETVAQEKQLKTLTAMASSSRKNTIDTALKVGFKAFAFEQHYIAPKTLNLAEYIVKYCDDHLVFDELR